MTRKGATIAAILALMTAATVAASQLYKSTRQLGEALARASEWLDTAHRHRPQPAADVGDVREQRRDPGASYESAESAGALPREPTAPSAALERLVNTAADEETDLRRALERALSDPDPDVRDEAAAVLGLELAEEAAPAQPRTASAP
jgi:hypothetical protein